MISRGLVKDSYNNWIVNYLDDDRHASILSMSFDYFPGVDSTERGLFNSSVVNDSTLLDGTILSQENRASFYVINGSTVDLDMREIYRLSPDSFFHNHYRPFLMVGDENDDVVNQDGDDNNCSFNNIGFRLNVLGKNELTNPDSIQGKIYSELYSAPDGYTLTWNRNISLDSQWQEDNINHDSYDAVDNTSIQNLLKGCISKSIVDDNIRFGSINNYVSLDNIKDITDNDSAIEHEMPFFASATIQASGIYGMSEHNYTTITVDSDVDYHYDYDRLEKPDINPLDCPYLSNLANYLVNSTDDFANSDDILSFNLTYQLSVLINSDTVDYRLEVVDRVGINSPIATDDISDDIVDDIAITSELL